MRFWIRDPQLRFVTVACFNSYSSKVRISFSLTTVNKVKEKRHGLKVRMCVTSYDGGERWNFLMFFLLTVYQSHVTRQ